jgi:hypothetical protein
VHVPVHVAATVAWRLPGALMGVILFVVAGSMFGPPGVLLAAIWLVTGLLTGFRFGERALIRTVLRYRPAPTSWLEAEVRRLLPGRRVDVYVAPKATGVFALGGHTIGLGEASVGAGDPTPGLLAAAAAAAEQLRAGRTRPELPLLWWCLPWWFAKKIDGHFFRGLALDHEWDEDLADAVALEAHADRQARPGLGEGFDGEVHAGPDRAVNPANAPAVGRLDVNDLGRGRTLGAADATGGDAVVPDPRKSLPVHAPGDDAVLPFVEVGRVDGIREHLVGRSVDVDADDGRGHGMSSVHSDAYRFR